jgi:hypothetical protein
LKAPGPIAGNWTFLQVQPLGRSLIGRELCC